MAALSPLAERIQGRLHRTEVEGFVVCDALGSVGPSDAWSLVSARLRVQLALVHRG
jgi:hypothetical protein